MNQVIISAARWFNSLQARLMISALFIIMLVLPVVGVLLNNAFTEQIQRSAETELKAYSYAILAVAEVENTQLYMPDLLLENQFNVSESGLYALITSPKNKTLWSSPSLLGLNNPQALVQPNVGATHISQVIINQQTHLMYSFTVSFGEGKHAFPITVHIMKDQNAISALFKQFKRTLWTWLLVLAVGLIVVQLLWLSFTLKPFKTIETELQQVEQGQRKLLQQSYPLELSRVANQFNGLLTTEHNQRTRYRNALSNLAHSLKTPLAVIQTQTELSTITKQQLEVMNKTIEHQLKRAQSGGQSSWHIGVAIAPIANKLIKTLTKIHQNKQLTFSINMVDNAIFKGEEADLFEILGNLLDNACKAAKSTVALTVCYQQDQLIISVADNGVGIGVEQRQHILTRGTRADTYQQGHGIGLAIVRDLIHSYQGQITIAQSPELGGALFVLTLKR